jgi:hypothetical protein
MFKTQTTMPTSTCRAKLRAMGLGPGRGPVTDFEGCGAVTATVAECTHNAEDDPSNLSVTLRLSLSAEGREPVEAFQVYPLDTLGQLEAMVRDFAAFGVAGVDGDDLDAACRKLAGRALRLGRMPGEGEGLAGAAAEAKAWVPDEEARAGFFGFSLPGEWVDCDGMSQMPPRPGMTRAELCAWLGRPANDIERFPDSAR